jgi:hypothetical protein
MKNETDKKELGAEVDLSITVMAFLIRFGIVIVIVGVCALLGKLFYGLTDASKESIAQAAENECMKAHILSYRAENGAINKSTLWDYERDCELKSEYQKQVEEIKTNKNENKIKNTGVGNIKNSGGIPTIDVASTIMSDGKINTDKIREFCGGSKECFDNINDSASKLSMAAGQESQKELTRSLFNINMVFIEVLRHSGNANNKNETLQELLENGCAIGAVRELVVEGYYENDKKKLNQAHVCAEKLAVALGYRG